MFPELKRAGKAAKKSKPAGEAQAISIRGLTEGISYTLGQCCHPMPGDRIVGLTKPGEGLVIHTIDCAELDKAQDMSDWLDVSWGHGVSETGQSVARILVRVKNAPGSLAAVMTAIAANGGNIFNMKMTSRNPICSSSSPWMWRCATCRICRTSWARYGWTRSDACAKCIESVDPAIQRA